MIDQFRDRLRFGFSFSAGSVFVRWLRRCLSVEFFTSGPPPAPGCRRLLGSA
jgi:hypothetical protein